MNVIGFAAGNTVQRNTGALLLGISQAVGVRSKQIDK
jgi:hypothetical protein